MRWLDLSAYGIRLRVRPRDPDPPIMFVMDGGDAVAAALTHAGFRRTMSGLWMRQFEPSEAKDILHWLAFDLPDGTVRDIDPAEIVQGHVSDADGVPDGEDMEAAIVPVDAATVASGDETCEDADSSHDGGVVTIEVATTGGEPSAEPVLQTDATPPHPPTSDPIAELMALAGPMAPLHPRRVVVDAPIAPASLRVFASLSAEASSGAAEAVSEARTAGSAVSSAFAAPPIVLAADEIRPATSSEASPPSAPAPPRASSPLLSPALQIHMPADGAVGPRAPSATPDLTETLAALAELAATIGRPSRPVGAAADPGAPAMVVSETGDEPVPEPESSGPGAAEACDDPMSVAEDEPPRWDDDAVADLPVRPRGPLLEASDEAGFAAEDDEMATAFDLAWTVSAGPAAVRHLTGAPGAGERNHLVAKLSRDDDGPRARASVGALVYDAAGTGPVFRLVAVARGIDGSGFGSSDDLLLIGDPGEGVGALVRAGIEEEAA